MTKIIWCGVLSEVTYQRRNGFAHNTRLCRRVIKRCRYNQPQSSARASCSLPARRCLFITHLPPSGSTKRRRSWEKLQAPALPLQTAAPGPVMKPSQVLPWKPSRNLEPSGSSSGVYSLYPPTKSWLKTLRPTRGPGDHPVRFRCPSTWGNTHTHTQERISKPELGGLFKKCSTLMDQWVIQAVSTY